MKRKIRYFADNRRIILSYEITVLPEQYRLAVVSTLTGEGKEEAVALQGGMPAATHKKQSLLTRILALFPR